MKLPFQTITAGIAFFFNGILQRMAVRDNQRFGTIIRDASFYIILSKHCPVVALKAVIMQIYVVSAPRSEIRFLTGATFRTPPPPPRS